MGANLVELTSASVFDVVCKGLCVVFCVMEVRDMLIAARDEEGPFGLRALCIIADAALMTLATKVFWA